MMDIILATNSVDPALALRGIEVFSDGSGISCTLALRSGWMSAAYRLAVEIHPLERFVAALRELDRTLEGEAILKPQWEPQHLRFSGDGLGRVSVAGELIEHGPHRQFVSFEFATDQTCLGPLVRALDALMRSIRDAAEA